MSTLGDLIGSIASALHSYTGVQEQSTHLTADIAADDLLIQVANSESMMRGVIEVDDELLYVDVSDANVLSIAPYGRGYRASTAAAHLANSQVINDPSFPRCEILRSINQCIDALYPTLYQIKSTDIAVDALRIGYQLPADCETIIEVKFQAPSDPYDFWVPYQNWRFDPTSPEATGRTINFPNSTNMPAGSTVRVVYQAPFGQFASVSDTFASVGLRESYADLILYGVTARMVRFLDPARLQLTTVENVSRAGVVATGDAGKIANQLYAVYQQRLLEERKKLLDLTPTQIHFTR